MSRVPNDGWQGERSRSDGRAEPGGEHMRHEHEGHEEQDASALALRFLSGKEPSAAVQRRIVEGALSRRKPAFPWTKAFTGLALAGAAAAAVVVTFRVDSPVGPSAPTVAAIESPAAGEVRGAGTFAVGPHRIEVAAGGSVRFQGVNPGAAEFRVDAGSAVFDVEKLAAGESFRVHTGQVLVEVVGTQFAVGIDGDCSSVTVTEGRVRVTEPAGIRYLTVGESGRYCAPKSAEIAGAGESLVRDALVLVSGGEDLRRAAGLLERYRAEHPGGALEEEALFHLTLVKARLGERAAANELAATFRKRFPDSPRMQRIEQWLDRTAH